MGRVAVVLSSLLCVIAFGVAGCGGGGDTPAAIVNGEEIGNAELQERLDQIIPVYEAQGLTVDDAMRARLEQQVLDEMIAEEVLAQAAQREGFQATDEEVQSYYAQIAGQFGDSFNERLEEQGLTPESFREIVARQLSIQKYLEAKLGEANIQVGDAEVDALYQQYREFVGDQEIPPLEEVRPQLVAELERRAQNQFIDNHIADLRAQSQIEVLIATPASPSPVAPVPIEPTPTEGTP